MKLPALTIPLLLLLAGPVHAGTRVALVSTCGGDAGADVLALAEAKLSQESGIELVERREVERVLQEQKLASCGLSSYGQAVAAGKLLGVDVFAALEILPKEKEALGLVCFAAGSGARLMDVVLPADKTASASEILGAVREAIAKQQLPDLDRKTICVLSVRNAGLPREFDELCESVSRLLERRLLSSASLAVLERARLDQINQERRLPTGISLTNALVGAMALLELEFSRGTGSNEVHAVLLLSNSAGQSQARIQADSRMDRSADLAESLSLQLAKAMKAGPLGRKLDRKAEALRFSREADFFSANSHTVPALQAGEAAYALDPENPKLRTQLCCLLIAMARARMGNVYASPNQVSPDSLKQSLALAQRGVQLNLEELLAMTSAQRITDAVLRPSSSTTTVRTFMEDSRNISAGHDVGSRAQYAELQRLYRRIFVEVSWRAVFDSIQTEPGLTDGAGLCFYLYLNGVELGAADSGILTTDLLSGLNLWLQRVIKVGNCRVNHARTTWVLSPILFRLCYPERMVHDKRGHLYSLTEGDIKRLHEFFGKLKDHPEPLLQMYGWGADLATVIRVESETGNSVPVLLDKIKSLGKIALIHPPCPSAHYRTAVYQMLLDVCDLFTEPARRQQEHTELFNDMVARNEYVARVAMAATDPGYWRYSEYFSYRSIFHSLPVSGATADHTSQSNNLVRLVALLASPTVNKIKVEGGWRGTLDQQLKQLCDKLGIEASAVVPPTPPPWTSAALLLTNGFQKLTQPRITGDSLWALDAGEYPHSAARLVRVPLDGRSVEYYDQIPLESLPDQQYAIIDSFDDKSGRRLPGIRFFPPETAAMRWLTESNGLPTGPITAAVCCNGKLYAAIGKLESAAPSYLIKCDLKTGVVDLVASSLRREKRSPLDGASSSFPIRRLRADPNRHRVLFTVDDGSLTGLWSIDTQTDQIKLLVRLVAGCDWVSPIRGNELLLFRYCVGCTRGNAVISFNLETSTAQIIYATTQNKDDRYLYGQTPPEPIDAGISAPLFRLNDSLWAGAPFSRSLSNGVPRELLPSFTGKPLPQRRSWDRPLPNDVPPPPIQYMEPVNDGRQVLINVNDQLWLLTLPEKPTKETP